MLDLGRIRDPDAFSRRLAVTVALLIAYRLGTQIPLPGMSAEVLAQLGASAWERLSIFALGITPFITVLILVELVKVIAPSLRRWEHANERNRYRLGRIVVGLSLLAAAVQSTGVVVGLEGVSGLVAEPGNAFRLTCVATMVGATAIVIWLADQITRHGLGSGAWLLLLTGWLANLPSFVAAAVWPTYGGAPILGVLAGFVIAVLVLAAYVGVVGAGRHTLETAATCLWSRVLATTVWPWLIIGIGIVLGGGSLQSTDYWMVSARPLYLVQLVLLAGLVALFVYAYVRSLRDVGSAVPAIPQRLLALAMGGLVLAELVPASFAIAVPLAGHLIIVAVVALSILARFWQPPFASPGAH